MRAATERLKMAAWSPYLRSPITEYHCTVQMDIHFWLWFGGQFDGDGSLGVYNGYPVLSISKAKKGAHVLTCIQKELGGSITYQPAKGPNRQSSKVWRVYSHNACEVAQRLIPFVHIKKEQCELLSKFAPGLYPVMATKDGVRVKFHTRKDLASVIGVSASTLYAAWKKCQGDVLQFRGYTLENRKVANRQIEDAIKKAKQIPHSAINKLHPAYTAGFFYAEGYVRLRRCLPQVQIKQKYKSVLQALQDVWGGQIYLDSGCYTWCIASKGAYTFLQIILPFLREKKNQVEMGLAATPNTFKTIELKLRQLRGNSAVKKL